MKHSLLITLLVVIAAAIVIGSAKAESIGSDYAVTNNWQGIDVPIGSNVIVTAWTTDATVYQVTFLWKNPGETIVWTDIVPVFSNGTTYDDMLVYYAISTHTPQDLGDWGVQALFQSPDGSTKQGVEEVIAIRATSFNVIPEIPLIGTMGAAAAMLLGLGIFTTRRKK
jgi:hypothetical protein